MDGPTLIDMARREGKRHLPKERSRLNRAIFNDTVVSFIGVVVAIAIFGLAGLALDWWVFHDRYGVGFWDYLRVIVF